VNWINRQGTVFGFQVAAGLLIIGLAVAFSAAYLSWFERPPDLMVNAVYEERLEHPAHIVRIGDQYLATELFTNRIMMANTVAFDSAEPISLSDGEKLLQLASPHFLQAIDDRQVLISEGWGSGVIVADVLSGSSRRYTGPSDRALNAPHGICQRRGDSWIYVADSLNSRLLRFENTSNIKWEIFPDTEKMVSYGRQLLCLADGVWLSNSYEDREGLNSGAGSNILRISEFTSGRSEVIASFPNVNLTGLEVINDRWIIVGLWGDQNRLLMIDARGHYSPVSIDSPEGIPGPPYGLFYDKKFGQLLVAFTGNIHDQSHNGAIVVYTVTR